jgi:hypothetical protein
VADHPVKVPPELVKEWTQLQASDQEVVDHWVHIANRAAQWAADQELEACCEWLRSKDILEPAIDALRSARRPKPPSLAEQGLKALGPSVGLKHFRTLSVAEQDDIRAALNRLAELEAQQ